MIVLMSDPNNEPQKNNVVTGAVAITHNQKQFGCYVCGYMSQKMHLLTLASHDNLGSTRVPLCEKCAHDIADDLLAAIEAGYASSDMAKQTESRGKFNR